MIEKQKLNIKNKIVTATDIRRLAKTFSEICAEYVSKASEENRRQRDTLPKYRMVSKDDTEYETSDLDIFETDGILDTKVFKEVGMHFGNYKEANIDIYIYDSGLAGFNISRIEVEGETHSWVSDTFHRLEDCTSSWADQNLIVRKYKWPISLSLVYLIGLTVVSLISAFSPAVDSLASSPELALYPLIGLGLSVFMAEYLDKLWPELELVPVSAHEQKLQNMRKRLKYVLTAIIVPLAISLGVSYYFNL